MRISQRMSVPCGSHGAGGHHLAAPQRPRTPVQNKAQSMPAHVQTSHLGPHGQTREGYVFGRSPEDGCIRDARAWWNDALPGLDTNTASRDYGYCVGTWHLPASVSCGGVFYEYGAPSKTWRRWCRCRNEAVCGLNTTTTTTAGTTAAPLTTAAGQAWPTTTTTTRSPYKADILVGRGSARGCAWGSASEVLEVGLGGLSWPVAPDPRIAPVASPKSTVGRSENSSESGRSGLGARR